MEVSNAPPFTTAGSVEKEAMALGDSTRQIMGGPPVGWPTISIDPSADGDRGYEARGGRDARTDPTAKALVREPAGRFACSGGGGVVADDVVDGAAATPATR
jgi:hypothetical protein